MYTNLRNHSGAFGGERFQEGGVGISHQRRLLFLPILFLLQRHFLPLLVDVPHKQRVQVVISRRRNNSSGSIPTGISSGVVFIILIVCRRHRSLRANDCRVDDKMRRVSGDATEKIRDALTDVGLGVVETTRNGTVWIASVRGRCGAQLFHLHNVVRCMVVVNVSAPTKSGY